MFANLKELKKGNHTLARFVLFHSNSKVYDGVCPMPASFLLDSVIGYLKLICLIEPFNAFYARPLACALLGTHE